MKRLACYTELLCLVALSALTTETKVNAVNPSVERSVGGRNVLQNEGNFQAAITYKRRLTCSGSILSSDMVLTSASCVQDLDLSHIKVRCGSKIFKTGGQVRSVIEILLHPLYQKDEHMNNIALLKLKRAFNLTSTSINGIKLPKENQKYEFPSFLFIYGWGISSLNVNGTLSKHLRVSKYKVYSHSKCLRYLSGNDKQNDSTAICVGDRSKHFDICNDDSGGPAVNQNQVQYGVISHGGKCFPENVIILTNIVPHLSWIRNVLRPGK